MSEHNYEYFRRTYGVPARRNAPVKYKGRKGKITGTNGPYVLIKFDGDEKGSGFVYHPTWEMEWLDAN